jgi:hypothetical protein
MKREKYEFKINTLTRTLEVERFEWGVRVIKGDKPKDAIRTYYETRNFYLTKKYPTIEANVKRGLSYFKYYKFNKQ